MHNLFGNSAQKTGYACLMEELVSQVRAPLAFLLSAMHNNFSVAEMMPNTKRKI